MSKASIPIHNVRLDCVSTDMIKVSDWNEFWTTNICIPRGENRLPDADLLHQWVEGKVELEEEGAKGEWDYTDTVGIGYRYRIKPEPIYEWQFVCLQGNGKSYLTEFYTDKQVSHSLGTFIKIEETRRERK